MTDGDVWEILQDEPVTVRRVLQHLGIVAERRLHIILNGEKTSVPLPGDIRVNGASADTGALVKPGDSIIVMNSGPAALYQILPQPGVNPEDAGAGGRLVMQVQAGPPPSRPPSTTAMKSSSATNSSACTSSACTQACGARVRRDATGGGESVRGSERPAVGPTSLLPGGKWVNLKSFDPLAGCFGSGRPTRCNPSRFQNLPHEAARAKTPSQSRFPPSFRESSCEGACRHRDEQRRPSRLPTSTSASSPPGVEIPDPRLKNGSTSRFSPH